MKNNESNKKSKNRTLPNSPRKTHTVWAHVLTEQKKWEIQVFVIMQQENVKRCIWKWIFFTEQVLVVEHNIFLNIYKVPVYCIQ